MCWPIGRALQALHGRGILHRNLRPACVLIRKVKNSDGASRLQVKLLDAGLAIKRVVIHASISNPESRLHSGLGRSVARCVPFSPPEVVGRPKGQVWVGPHSDIFSFGKLCAFGLTGRPDPDGGDRLLLPDAWQTILDDCTAWTINRRPANLGIVVDRIAQTPGAADVVGRIERELHESTITELTAFIEADPSSAVVFINRGSAHARHGNHALAIADFTEAMKLQPADAALSRRRALSYSRTNNADAAIADYTEALRLEPRNLEALVNRGMAHAQKGEQDRAVADFTEGLRLNPRDEMLYLNRGNAWFSIGDLDRAIADYTEAVRLDARNLSALGNRAKTLRRAGRAPPAPSPTSRESCRSIRTTSRRWPTAPRRRWNSAGLTAPSPTTRRPFAWRRRQRSITIAAWRTPRQATSIRRYTTSPRLWACRRRTPLFCCRAPAPTPSWAHRPGAGRPRRGPAHRP